MVLLTFSDDLWGFDIPVCYWLNMRLEIHLSSMMLDTFKTTIQIYFPACADFITDCSTCTVAAGTATCKTCSNSKYPASGGGSCEGTHYFLCHLHVCQSVK